jgi:hypothetical protein
MKEHDTGGGNVGGRNEFKKLKRKSDESIEVGGKKLKKKWNTIRRKKSNRGKKFQKKGKWRGNSQIGRIQKEGHHHYNNYHSAICRWKKEKADD